MKQRLLDTWKDLKQKFREHLFYVVIYFILMCMVASIIMPFKYTPLHFILIVAWGVLSIPLNSLLYGYYIKDNKFLEYEVPKTHYPYMDYKHRIVYSMGIGITLIAVGSFIIFLVPIGTENQEFMISANEAPHIKITVWDNGADDNSLVQNLIDLATSLTIFAVGISLMQMSEAEAKRRKKEHSAVSKENKFNSELKHLNSELREIKQQLKRLQPSELKKPQNTNKPKNKIKNKNKGKKRP